MMKTPKEARAFYEKLLSAFWETSKLTDLLVLAREFRELRKWSRDFTATTPGVFVNGDAHKWKAIADDCQQAEERCWAEINS